MKKILVVYATDAGSTAEVAQAVSVDNYLQPVLKAAPGVEPLRAGFLGGKFYLFPLSWWQKLFVILVVQA